MHLSSSRRVRRSLVALMAAALAFGSGAAAAQALSIPHSKGVTELKAPPKKLVVLDMASLDTLHALGAEVAGVPKFKYPPALAQYEAGRYAKVGSLFEPDLEAINRLAPDLVVVGGRSSAKFADVARVAPAIDLTVDTRRYLDSALDHIRVLGRVSGKEAQAAGLIDKLQASIAAVRQKAKGAGKGLVVLTTGGRMSAYGPGSRFGMVYDAFGIEPAATQLKVANHGQAASFEFLLETNPDWLFVIDRDAAIGREGVAARQYLDNELVRKTSAWTKGQVVYLDAASWYLMGAAGLGALQTAVDQVSAALDKRR